MAKPLDLIQVGRSGLKISRIGLGCMSFGVEARAWRLDAAFARRDKVVIAKKLFFQSALIQIAAVCEITWRRALGSRLRWL